VTAHEVVIRLGRRFDIRTSSGAYLAGISEITVPFADRESAEAAQREITVHVRPVHDAGGEDYRRVVPGEVVREAAEIEPGASASTDPEVVFAEMQRHDTGPHCRVYWGSHGCCHPRGHPPEVPHECDCCECPGECELSCMAKPPYYGPDTRFYGEDAEALGLPGVPDIVADVREAQRRIEAGEIADTWSSP